MFSADQMGTVFPGKVLTILFSEIKRDRNAAIEDLNAERRLRQAVQEANRELVRALDEETEKREVAEQNVSGCQRCQQWELIYEEKVEELRAVTEDRNLAKNKLSQERELRAAAKEAKAQLQAELTASKKDCAAARQETSELKQCFAEVDTLKKEAAAAEEARRKLKKERRVHKKTATMNGRLQQDLDLSREKGLCQQMRGTF